MNTRINFRLAPIRISGLALLLLALSVQAEPLRVTSWNLQPSAAADTNGWSAKYQQSLVQEAAESLKKLNPDVIVLQQIVGWDTCRQLAQALQPQTYQVVICSSFRDPRTRLLSRQAAILSKVKAYISWSDSWQTGADSPGAPGGFAFAAIRVEDKTIGIFSIQLGDDDGASAEDSRSPAAQQAREESVRQLVKQIASLQNWKTNRPDAFVIAGDFNTTPDDLRLVHEQTLSRLEQYGFENAFAGLPLEKRVTVPGNAQRPDATLDYVFTRDASVIAAPLLIQTTLSGHSGVSCDLDLAAPRRIAALPPMARAETPTAIPVPSPTNRATPPVTLAKTTAPAGDPRFLWWLAGIFVAGLALLLFVRKLLRHASLQRALADSPAGKSTPLITFATPHADKIIVAPPSESPPFVHIEMASSTQTQSQSWRARGDTARVMPQMPESVRAGVIANLSRWLKQKLVRQLVSDRAQLLATQQAAALKVLAVDERLTKIEQQIQQRNQDYEKRIDELQQELLTAREENRELIRAKIALIKAEMEKSRLKTGQHQQN